MKYRIFFYKYDSKPGQIYSVSEKLENCFFLFSSFKVIPGQNSEKDIICQVKLNALRRDHPPV